MPRTVNPVKRLLLKKSLREGKGINQSLRDANYSEGTIRGHNNSTSNIVVRSCVKEIEQELNDKEIIDKLKRLLRLKLDMEMQLFDEISHDNDSSRKEKMTLINKTKDNIAEITKTLRLVEGQSTENIDIKDRDFRLDRLKNRLLPVN